MAAFVAKQMVGNKLNAVKGKRVAFVFRFRGRRSAAVAVRDRLLFQRFYVIFRADVIAPQCLCVRCGLFFAPANGAEIRSYMCYYTSSCVIIRIV